MRASRGNLWPRARLSGDHAPERQRLEAIVGADVRSWLAEHGSPTWEPAEDPRWRDWVELNGDAYARDFARALDELLRRDVGKRRERDPEWRRQKAKVGAEIRCRLAAHGSPTWEPADDHTWREWIEFQGDAFARRFLRDLDEMAHRMTPGMVGRGE